MNLKTDKNRKYKDKKKAYRRERHGDEQFKRLASKMVGLSNMISLLTVSKQSAPYEHLGADPIKFGGIHPIGSKFGAFCNFPGIME